MTEYGGRAPRRMSFDHQLLYRLDMIDVGFMEDLNRYWTGVAIAGEIPDNRGKLNHYLCTTCAASIATVDRDAGLTPPSTSCITMTPGHVAVSMRYPPLVHPEDYGGRIDFEYYRPLSEEEIEDELDVVKGVIEQAIVDQLSPRPNPDDIALTRAHLEHGAVRYFVDGYLQIRRCPD